MEAAPVECWEKRVADIDRNPVWLCFSTCVMPWHRRVRFKPCLCTDVREHGTKMKKAEYKESKFVTRLTWSKKCFSFVRYGPSTVLKKTLIKCPDPLFAKSSQSGGLMGLTGMGL
ncbi:uncharacterized protein PGTG_01251 [Puccinia graminis f. sp. tritici CRL 75-36-700-3]|uniref:Uncharacterized protein n=1 Tax=Puccinia graminis f. sp. tritici (strain CRL 75-36-700-3 / race SCCL) TaxID=418459 RepID=E3JV45_PUCGT|nr:uncharacterized protein PGTG_01251 [Puccinia graminis f. sp. tritici CRL 75-36-700-3]EFP75920.1 hypothetical protein PGTG_01251 [Puccinia graminis f. sp. tritici CRL 75-36-700-3]